MIRCPNPSYINPDNTLKEEYFQDIIARNPQAFVFTLENLVQRRDKFLRHYMYFERSFPMFNAMDAFVDAFTNYVKQVEKGKRFKTFDDVATYIIVSAYNNARRTLAKLAKKSKKLVSFDSMDILECPDSLGDVYEIEEKEGKAEKAIAVRKALKKLSIKDREIILKYKAQGKAAKDYARDKKISVSASDKAFQRAKNRFMEYYLMFSRMV